MHEYLFKAMVKEANYLEENGWSQELVSAGSSDGCITVLATTSEFAQNRLRLSLICQLTHALESHKISRSGRSWGIFGVLSAFLQHEVPSDSACLFCWSCEYFAAAEINIEKEKTQLQPFSFYCLLILFHFYPTWPNVGQNRACSMYSNVLFFLIIHPLLRTCPCHWCP